jgi:hypothetical protein
MLCVLLPPGWESVDKSYVRAHERTLPSGRTVHVPAYFTRRVAHPKEGAKERAPHALKQAPARGVHPGQTHEQLAHRLVRHVHEGTMSHEEAEANLAHLERRAHAGHHLEHGTGRAWTPEETHQFIAHARGRLAEHKEGQARQAQEAHAQRIEELTGKEAQAPGRYQVQRDASTAARPFRIHDTMTHEPARHPEYGHVLRFGTEADARQWAERENARHATRQSQGQERQAEPAGQGPPRGITQQQRQEDWDARMRQRQQEERERQGQQAEREGPRREGEQQEQKPPQLAERFLAGKTLTPKERKRVLESLQDRYRETGHRKILVGVDARGEEIWRYPHEPDRFIRSDITGKMLRHYIQLPDNRLAHPTELFPEIRQSEVNRRITAMEAEQRQSRASERDLAERRARRISDSRNDANMRYSRTGRGVEGSYFAENAAGQVVRVDGTDPADVAHWQQAGFRQSSQPVPTRLPQTQKSLVVGLVRQRA